MRKASLENIMILNGFKKVVDGMNNTHDTSDRLVNINSEFTRLLVNYWELLGRPSLSEFVSLLPIQVALEEIERVDMDGQVRIRRRTIN